jgi:signal transduction histidine kinase
MAHPHERDLSGGRAYAHRVRPARPSWLRRRPSWLADAALALLLGLVVGGAAVRQAIDTRAPFLPVLALVGVSLVFLRRRWPFESLAAGLVVEASQPHQGAFLFPVLTVLYTIASTRSWRATAMAAGLIAVTPSVALAISGQAWDIGNAAGPLALSGVVVALGLYAANRRASMDALRERAERLDRERELLADRAVAQERVRIAQELHDVVAHNVSLMVVQAQALGATSGDPRVAQATDGIAELGRQAMSEMHRTLTLLRADDEAPQLSPQPGLANLDRLIEQSRAAGLPVEVTIEGEPRTLPESVDLSAFRIVQEALTNVVKHAGRARTSVTIDYRPDALELTITDEGDGLAAGAVSAPGHGILGMRERAAMFGGTLTAQRRDGDGFVVNAVLPYGDHGGR